MMRDVFEKQKCIVYRYNIPNSVDLSADLLTQEYMPVK